MNDHILRRKWILENMELLLRESAYHRGHEEAEALPCGALWQAGQEIGEYHVAAIRSQ